MSTTVLDPTASPAVPVRERQPATPIPLGRIVRVELRKMVDTRAGFWLLMAIGILSVLATGAAILFAPQAEQDFELYASSIGVPMSVILPMIAILSVTGEYTQRTGLSTYTMLPRRGRTIGAKLIAGLIVGVGGMFVALAVGALGNLLAGAVGGFDPVWNIEATEFAQIVLAQTIGMLTGFTLGALFRSSATAIVLYFVVTLVVPNLLFILANLQDWYGRIDPWVNLEVAKGELYDGVMTAENWAQLGTSGVIWLVVPFLVGLTLIMRSEVK